MTTEIVEKEITRDYNTRGMDKDKERMNNKYEDIINLKRPISKKHPPMPLEERAAQFAPFAALTGYEETITETAREVDKRIELDEEAQNTINRKIQELKQQIVTKPIVAITYFQKDLRKEGGEYITVTEKIRKIDDYKKIIVLENKTEIPIREILDIDIP